MAILCLAAGGLISAMLAGSHVAQQRWSQVFFFSALSLFGVITAALLVCKAEK